MAASSDSATGPGIEPLLSPAAAPEDKLTGAAEESTQQLPSAKTDVTSVGDKTGEPTKENAVPDAAGTAPEPALAVLPDMRPGKETAKDATATPTALETFQATDDVNPLDFDGSVETNKELPSAETLRRIGDYVVLDRDGRSRPFRSLYMGKHVARRVLIIFVRHFFCGNCQEYLRALSASITPEDVLALPISTFIAVVGCGDPALIGMYAAETGCRFPIYTDPTRRLYSELGMVRSLALGSRPAYMSKSVLKSSLESIVQGLRQIPKGLATKSGDQRQIGGEFLFEPSSLHEPGTNAAPWAESLDGKSDDDWMKSGERVNDAKDLGDGDDGAVVSPVERAVEEKRVTWCHRMRTTRDHAEIPELMEVLGLEGHGVPVDSNKQR